MPIYSYVCKSCGVQFDHSQRFTDPLLRICPECGEQALRKTFSPVGIVFKGSGFYATDHRSPSGQNSTRKTEKPEGASVPESDTSSDDD